MTERPTPTEPPEEYEDYQSGTHDGSKMRATREVEGGQKMGTTAEVLLVKDCDPWTITANEEVLTELDATWDHVDSSDVAGTELSNYSTVVVASTQPPTFYENLAESKAKIESFVADGGVLIAHALHIGWPCDAQQVEAYLPRNVEIRDDISDEATILAESHPIIDGIEEADFGDSEIQGAHFTSFPSDTEVLVRDDVNNQPSYIEYSHGSGLVVASGLPLEWPWYPEGEGGPTTKQLLRNELAYALNADVKDSVSASVTTLQFIPGRSENTSEGGHPLDSGLMQVVPEDERWSVWGKPIKVPADPVLDSWLGGDMIEELPDTLEAARGKKTGKYRDDTLPDEAFKEYRFENGVSVSFETNSDGSIDEDSVEITFNEVGSSGDDPIISRGDEENSATVLHDHEINGIPWGEWYDENVRESNRQNRYYKYDTNFEFEGVEGVRVRTVWGGYAGFVGDISKRASDNAADFFSTIWDWPVPDPVAKLAMLSSPRYAQFLTEALTAIPNTYTFIDFIVLADGRRYVRIWDASSYPSLFTYVDGVLEAKEKMSYDPKELWNKDMFAFHALASAGATPYNCLAHRIWGSVIRGEDDVWTQIEEGLEEKLDLLPIEQGGWSAHQLMPSIPRETLAFHNAEHDGEEPIDPDGPFPSPADFRIKWSGELPPK